MALTPILLPVPPLRDVAVLPLPHLPIPDLALTLALAVVESSTTPLVLLDGGLIVLAASASFCIAFEIDPDDVLGREIYTIGHGEWNVPRLRSLLSAITSGGVNIPAYEIDLQSAHHGIRRLVLNAHKLDYDDDQANVRLVLAVADVTEARAAAKLKEELLRDKAMLLQEVQHRVANSLQIIASVLMQSARKVSSEETRGHLADAHNRVMSIAAVQQQLAVSGSADVGVGAYLSQLCQSLGASMIRDHAHLSIVVDADASAVTADISVSLGLIVTELVINSLKHGYPGSRGGTITVGYHTHGNDWTLSVVDDGIGMPEATASKPGLGTSIVSALARQLQAQITVRNATPGTAVTVAHTHDGEPVAAV